MDLKLLFPRTRIIGQRERGVGCEAPLHCLPLAWRCEPHTRGAVLGAGAERAEPPQPPQRTRREDHAGV